MRYVTLWTGLTPSAGPLYSSTAIMQVPGPRMAWTPLRPMRDSYPHGEEGKMAQLERRRKLAPPRRGRVMAEAVGR
jgi:hypothetical protein